MYNQPDSFPFKECTERGKSILQLSRHHISLIPSGVRNFFSQSCCMCHILWHINQAEPDNANGLPENPPKSWTSHLKVSFYFNHIQGAFKRSMEEPMIWHQAQPLRLRNMNGKAGKKMSLVSISYSGLLVQQNAIS